MTTESMFKPAERAILATLSRDEYLSEVRSFRAMAVEARRFGDGLMRDWYRRSAIELMRLRKAARVSAAGKCRVAQG